MYNIQYLCLILTHKKVAIIRLSQTKKEKNMRLLSLSGLIVSIFIAISMTGCVPPPPVHHAPAPGTGHKYYKKGYKHGCWTKQHKGVRKNKYLYNNNNSYYNGWRKGHAVCRKFVPRPGVRPVPVRPVGPILPRI